MMPGASGLEAIRNIRARNPRNRDLRYLGKIRDIRAIRGTGAR
jgi:hypothetical protein